ncbi:amidohydrolase/deacetylase family metallohydrolase [Paenibacillus cremeus]|uniref:Amidohydrolase/deacetylase family metallohydrolase n=1 Tax=Paenibacillus cremeus TaxID=2163881 RepID=A0A559K6I5_9BACL|nr:amidohydrolase/deacetylase family metallohydrolase [Paenibacillus cremeus]TVY07748.1 amidohydrolase/deacetylase family metallohydrolase [Paenibacillus cremeus]
MRERFVLHNARLVHGQRVDIVIEDGRIAEVTGAGSGLNEQTQIIDCTELYVSSGWIDMHVHAFPELDPYGDEIDEIGIKQGVTTIVDAGSCGADQIADLAASTEGALTRVFAFLNISRIGLRRIDELSDMAWIDKEQAMQAIQQHQAFIVGLKARMSRSVVGPNGIEPLRAARKLSEASSLPIMVHIGSGPPRIEEIVPLLHKNDIITHYLNGKANNLFDAEGKPLEVLVDAVGRGVHLDVGHGTASFSFRVAETAKRHGIPIGTISTDIYRGNRINGPVFSMANVLSKFLYLGYPLEEVIEAVTSRAASWLGKSELGRIQVGDTANLTLFAVEQQPVTLVDSEGDSRLAERSIIAKGVVANGKFIECEVRS